MRVTPSSPITGRTSKVRRWCTLVEPSAQMTSLPTSCHQCRRRHCQQLELPTAILWTSPGEGRLREKRDAPGRYTLPTGANTPRTVPEASSCPRRLTETSADFSSAYSLLTRRRAALPH